MTTQIVVPRVVASAPKVIVSEWLEGTPLSRIIADGTQEQRDRAGHLLAVLHFSGPQRAGLLHADPHPGNFRLLADGRLGVIDFGATARLPDGHPEPIGRLLRWALAGKADEVLTDLRAEGFVRPNMEVDAQGVLDYLRPLLEPLMTERFHFTRAWMQEQAARIADPRTDASKLGPPAEPAAGLPAHPPRDDRLDRRALPARRGRQLPRRPRGMAPGLHGVRTPSRPSSR